MENLRGLFSRNQKKKPERPLSCYISYSRRDGLIYASRLVESLKSRGVNGYLQDDRIPAGSAWVDSLQEALNQADFAILVGTPGAFSSTYVTSEIRYLLDKNRVIVPIIFQGVEVPRYLYEIQWLREDASAMEKGPSTTVLSRLDQVLTSLPSEGGKSQSAPISTVSGPQKRPLNEGKLILVGRGEVGKTSLVRRLVDDRFNEDESKTEGIRITNWSLPVGKDTFRLNVWDFGGQEIMHATHQFFMTERSLYLLVLNGREGGEDLDAEYWLKHVQSFGGELPVIVVLNKIAQQPFDLNYKSLQARYPQICGFVKTDCRERTGLADLRQRIQSVVDGMPEMRLEFPGDWFQVKERLEQMQEEHLSHQRFVELCAEEGITDETDRDTLGFALHCLGIALNYREDIRLRETSILKPEWVTQAIYAILNSKKLADQQGELILQDLQEILPKQRYPLQSHLFLLELMRKFSLCFPFYDGVDRYLVPELLGKEEPDDMSAFPPEHCLNFEYRYGVLPEGLLPRFIVRTHSLSRGRPRWRSGVVLSHEGCLALVKANPIERQVVVRVKAGDAGGRRSLLAIIRYDLDQIHAEFNDRLDAQARVPLAEFPDFSVDYNKLVAFERQGVKEFPEFAGGQVVTVHVSELLNGVDFEEQRHELEGTVSLARSLFFSYSHKDEKLPR